MMESSKLPLWIKRRLGQDNLNRYIDDSIQRHPTPCDDFGDEFEFADNIISWACDDFLTENENSMLGENYDDVYDVVYNYVKDIYGADLLEDYVTTCEEYRD